MMVRGLRPLLIISLLVLAPSRADAILGDFLLGPELHLPWTAGVRLEWQPLDLVEPSLSLGIAPAGAVKGLRGDRPGPDALTLALRVTSQPVPLMGFSMNAGLRTFLADGVSLPALEIGIGWRLKLIGFAWMAELGALIGERILVPYLALGAFWIFDD